MGKGSIWNVVDVVQEKERDEKASKYFEDFDDAFIEECKAKAPTGDAEAQAGLGLYYLFGIRGEQDPNLGYKWVKKAADQKFAPAEYFVSACYQLGLGVEKDEQKALYWIERSARNGFENAQFTFGLAIENGKVDNNNQQPFEWYKRAAEQGHAEAQNQVGWCYQNGICGAPRSEAEALRWYEKSARQGFHKGQYNLGFCYYKGIGVAKNKEKAIELFEKAAAQGMKEAKEAADYLKYSVGSFCFITTAACLALNKGDDCYELQMFRKFRDEWLLKQKDGKDIIAEYYRIAPKIVSSIEMNLDFKRIYENIWTRYLSKCLSMIEHGQNSECKDLYIEMVQSLKRKYLDSI